MGEVQALRRPMILKRIGGCVSTENNINDDDIGKSESVKKIHDQLTLDQDEIISSKPKMSRRVKSPLCGSDSLIIKKVPSESLKTSQWTPLSSDSDFSDI